MIIMKIRKISEIAYLVIFIIASYEYLFGTNIDQGQKKHTACFCCCFCFYVFL
jgi:hypothetical protein